MQNILQSLETFLADLSSFAWGLPLLVLLTGGGIYLMVRIRFLPYRYLGHAIAILRGKYDDKNDAGQISHFQALSTALSATVGMGNIAGVAVAIALGGPGAVFWMWVSAVIGMSTKFYTGTLSIMYRGKDDSGELQGGPMYFIVEGLGKKWKPMAVFFSLCAMVGALPVFNAQQMTQALNDLLLQPMGVASGFTTRLTIGLIVCGITALVILGGVKRISRTAERLVPAMVGLYFLLVLSILIGNYEQVPYYFGLIFTDAFSASFYSGDAFLGGVVGGLILLGIRRGAFSNEAGIGTAPMAHGAAKTNAPVREGLVAMMGPAIDTLVVCSLTALAILVTGVWQSSEANGVSLTAAAFEDTLSVYGRYGLLLCILIFGGSSLFSYSYYGTKSMAYLFGTKYKQHYRYFYLASIILGATTSLSMMLNLIDAFFAFMAIPTMVATIIMAPRVVKEAKAYFEKIKGDQQH